MGIRNSVRCWKAETQSSKIDELVSWEMPFEEPDNLSHFNDRCFRLSISRTLYVYTGSTSSGGGKLATG